MGLALSDELISLRDTLRDFFSSRIGSDVLRRYVTAQETGSFVAADIRQTLWGQFAQFEFASCFSEASGVESGFSALALLAKESGRALCPEPLYEALFASNYVYSRHYTQADRDFLLRLGIIPTENVHNPGVMLCSSLIERPVATGVQLNGQSESYVFSAEVSQVDALPTARAYLMPLLVKGRKPQLGIVACGDALRQERSPSIDLTRAVYALTCDAVEVLPLTPALEVVQHEYRILKAAELAGIAYAVLERSTEYAKTREQFGKPIGSFQAIQHKLADMLLACESLDALVDFAVWAAQEAPQQRALAALSAISYACQYVPVVCEQAIQLHGGLGFTWEYDLHLYLRRAKKLQLLHAPMAAAERQLFAEARRVR